MNCRNLFLHALLSAALITASRLPAGTATLTIDATKPGPPVNPRMYGIFLEEINYGVDGGLYAELVANRAFEDSRPPEGFTLQGGRYKDAKGYDSGFTVRAGEVPRWSLVRREGAKGAMHLETTGGLNTDSPYCLRLDVEDATSGKMGVANTGFWGIGLKSGAAYELMLHARSGDGFAGSLSVCLEDAAGQRCSAVVSFKGLTADWQPFKASLTATKSEAQARLVILAEGKGKVWLDWVSLMPRETWKQRGLRPDLAQMIADLKPGFVRWPGGCVVEGGSVETAYNWKLGLGPVETRPERWTAWNYRRTHALGYFEYLQFCEDIGAKPLYVGFAGQTCLFRECENVPLPEMGWVVTNFLDAVEFARGPADSRWGALRAKAGHPKPFDLGLIEIGNENGTEAFPPRYRLVYDALKAAHPDITYIADLSWISRELMKDCAFQIEDVHYYSPVQWFLSNDHLYDQRDRKLPQVYLGELAATSADGGELKGNLLAALSEGVFMLGCERNADVVRMISYAPLLSNVQRVNGWHAMIYHDSTRCFGTASYYLWKLFGENVPSHTIATEAVVTQAKPTVITGSIGVDTWNTAAEFKDIRVEKAGQPLAFTGPWQNEGGRWTEADGVRRQSDSVTGLSYFGDETWTDYTLTLKARKLRGEEGFLIVFGRRGEEKIWWNLGGWGNREHGLEFNRNQLGKHARGSIETDRWYDLKVELAGARIRCYLDGQLVHDEVAPVTRRLFASAGRDEATGEMIVKAINTAGEPMLTRLQLNGLGRAGPEAICTVLTSANLADNNSMEHPVSVVPVTRRITLADTHEFPPHSLTVLRFKTNRD